MHTLFPYTTLFRSALPEDPTLDEMRAALAPVIPVHAGAETSVAATKSFVCTLVALTHLVAEWSQDAALLAALDDVGDVLEARRPRTGPLRSGR